MQRQTLYIGNLSPWIRDCDIAEIMTVSEFVRKECTLVLTNAPESQRWAVPEAVSLRAVDKSQAESFHSALCKFSSAADAQKALLYWARRKPLVDGRRWRCVSMSSHAVAEC